MTSRVSGESDVGPELEGGEDDEDVQDAEAEGDAGQGARPGLQPPGQHLGAVIPISVTRYRVSTTVWHRLPHIDVVKTIKN